MLTGDKGGVISIEECTAATSQVIYEDKDKRGPKTEPCGTLGLTATSCERAIHYEAK